jgi:hypothetical protein
MIATSMSAALVPAIAEARAQNHRQALQTQTEFSVRFAWLIGLAASFGLAAAAAPINVMFFTSATGSETMAILAFTAMFSVLNIVTGSILIGLGAPAAPAVSLFAAALLKLLLNALFVPRFGIDGAAAAAVAAYALAGLANLAVLARRSGVRFPPAAFVWRPLAAVAAMCAAVAACRLGAGRLLAPGGLPLAAAGRGANTAAALAGVTAGALAYAVALFRFGAVRRTELDTVPALGRRLIPLLERVHILPAAAVDITAPAATVSAGTVPTVLAPAATASATVPTVSATVPTVSATAVKSADAAISAPNSTDPAGTVPTASAPADASVSAVAAADAEIAAAGEGAAGPPDAVKESTVSMTAADAEPAAEAGKVAAVTRRSNGPVR